MDSWPDLVVGKAASCVYVNRKIAESDLFLDAFWRRSQEGGNVRSVGVNGDICFRIRLAELSYIFLCSC